jgi:hypothetical protein
MSTDAKVRTKNQQVTVLVGPYEGKHGLSMGASGRNEVKVYLFDNGKEITFDVSDLDIYSG